MSSFQDRQKSLFNELKNAEDQYGYSKTNKAAPQDYGTIDKYTYKKLKREMKQFRGRESIYKRPEANLRECLMARTIPDYIKNPQRYKYYSLADVTPDQMSDSTNTATALALIRVMEERDVAQSVMEAEVDLDDGVFKKPTFQMSSVLRKTPAPVPEEQPIFKNNKVIMPEYVVGVTKKKEKKVTINKDKSHKSDRSGTKVELKLDHLFEEDE